VKEDGDCGGSTSVLVLIVCFCVVAQAANNKTRTLLPLLEAQLQVPSVGVHIREKSWRRLHLP
jgi:hypothetical protein